MANEYNVEFLYWGALDRADLLRTNPATGEPEAVDAIVPEMVLLYLNAELAVLWDVLISTHEDYCIKRLTIPVVANTEDYSMPSDFYKFRKVFPMSNGQRGKPLRKFNLKDLGRSTLYPATLGTQIEGTRYKINGNRLWLDPTPTSAAELELWYVPQLEAIVNLKDRIDFRFPFGWEQYVIEGVAARCLEKLELDGSAQRARQKEILQRVLLMAEDRDVGEPFQMQDAEGYLDGGRYDY